MLSSRKFKNKRPIHQRKKDFIGFTIIFLLMFSMIIYYIYAEKAPSYLPEIYLSYSGKINRKDYINCAFHLDDEHILGKVRYRGATNVNRPKKGYRLEFEQQISLLGMREDDDWLLFANYMDHTRMRVKLSFDLWRSLQEKDHDMAILPDSEYISLFVNRKFQGLYLLAEKNDRKLFGLDQTLNELDSSLIFQTKGHTNLEDYEEGSWEQDWPNPEDLEIIDEVLPDLIDFINDSPDDEFFNSTYGIYSRFDKINLIDFLLFNFFNYHRDFWNKNYFLIRDTAPSKFHLIPWDFDGSFGQYGWIKYDAKVNDRSEINERNTLYERLLNNAEFEQSCSDRWFELREDVWSEDTILDMIDDMYEEIKDILEIDVRMWKPITVEDPPEDKYPDKYIYSTKEFDLDEYINYLYDWIEDRLEYCDSVFEVF